MTDSMLNYASNSPLSQDPLFTEAWEQYKQFLAERGMKTVTEQLLSTSDAREIDREALRREWPHSSLTLEQFCESEGGWGPSPAERVLRNFRPSHPPNGNFLVLGRLADIYNAWLATYSPPIQKGG